MQTKAKHNMSPPCRQIVFPIYLIGLICLDTNRVDASPAKAALQSNDEGAVGAETSADLSVSFKKYILKNGLEVILHEDHRNPFVAVSVWYHVGAFDEAKGKTGFAHLFEHLMFQGTPNVGDDNHIAYLEMAGASVRSGMVNGTTNQDRTNYFEIVPRNELELALWLESDRMGFLMDGMTLEKLNEQRDVVKNERFQGVENTPYGLAEEKLWKTVFPEEHPYYGMVIGSLEDLNSASLQDVAEFYSTYYAPSNATLTIAGDFSSAQANAWIEKYFGSLVSLPKPISKKVKAPMIDEERRVIYDEKLGKLPYVQLLYFTPPFMTAADANCDILAQLLAGGKSARLWIRLVEELQIAQSVRVYQSSMNNVSVFGIEAMLREGHSPEQVIDILDEEIENLKTKPPTEDEITRARNLIETQRLYGLQKIGGFSGKAEQLQSYNHYVGRPDYFNEDFNRYQKITPKSIMATVEKYLAHQKRGVLIANPATEKSSAASVKEKNNDSF